MALSLVVDRPCALNIPRFTLGIILEMRGSTQGFFPSFVTWKKNMLKLLKENINLLHTHILQDYGKRKKNSIMFVFLRNQWKGFVVHALL
jgi:hypothetical protein